MSMFRSTASFPEPGKLIPCWETARAPGNVPYLVDNLWEWKRPDTCPNRRYSVYASPSISLAQEFGGTGNGVVYEVELAGNFRIAQCKVKDAKKHPDCRDLPKLLIKNLGENWLDSSLEEKKEMGQLWIPCLDKQEVDMLFKSSSISQLRESIWESITFWDDVSTCDGADKLPQDKGEVFFEPTDGYYLKPISS